MNSPANRASFSSVTTKLSGLIGLLAAPLMALALWSAPFAAAEENGQAATPIASIQAGSAAPAIQQGAPQGDDHNFDHNGGPRIDDHNFGLALPQLIIVLIAIIAAAALAYRAGRKTRER